MHEEIIAEGEITIERTPRELIDWVESKINTPDEKTIRLRQGLAPK